MQIIDGRAIAQTIRNKVKQRVAVLPTSPGLAVILVGADPASHTYVGLKQKACEEVGIRFEKYLYFATETEETLINKIHELNAREDIHGILVQLPLPNQDADRVIAEIDPKKDVDGFHPENITRLKSGEPAIAPAVALGIMKLIDEGRKMQDKGRQKETEADKGMIISSELFAEPLIVLLAEQEISSTVVSPDDVELSQKTSKADILITAIGKPKFIKGEMIKPGAIVIDVGTTKFDDKIIGDVDRASVESVAGYLTPVPGGVGPMTVAMLLVNVLKAYSLLSS